LAFKIKINRSKASYTYALDWGWNENLTYILLCM
jgi:hypothetical protein